MFRVDIDSKLRIVSATGRSKSDSLYSQYCSCHRSNKALYNLFMICNVKEEGLTQACSCSTICICSRWTRRKTARSMEEVAILTACTRGVSSTVSTGIYTISKILLHLKYVRKVLAQV